MKILASEAVACWAMGTKWAQKGANRFGKYGKGKGTKHLVEKK